MAVGLRRYNVCDMDANKPSKAAPRGWSPELTVRAVVVPPSSKSHAIRALLAAGCARGTTQLCGLSRAEDVGAAQGLLEGLGVRIAGTGTSQVTIEGLDPKRWAASEDLEAGESGTLARLMTAALALAPAAGSVFQLSASGSLCERSSAPLLRCLRSAGATLTPGSTRGSWPLELVSCEAPYALQLMDPVSSQELSGLLLALATQPVARCIELIGEVPSRPYVQMTIDVLRAFGARIRQTDDSYWVNGPLVAPAEGIVLEPDASAAAVALAAACLSGGETRIEGFGEESLQGDVAIVEHLKAFGCKASLVGGVMRASGRPLHPATLDLHGQPDLAPVLAAVAGAVALDEGGSRVPSTLTGLETLNAKECARLDVLAQALRALGLDVSATSSSLMVGPGTATAGPLLLDPHGDHRMAFAFALLGLVRPGLTVSDPTCVAKSWPDFWQACVRGADPENLLR